MRGKIVKHLIKKELTDVIRDKKTVFAMIGIPILLYPIMMIAMSFILQMTMEDTEDDRTQVVLEGVVSEGFLLFAEGYYDKVDFIEDSDFMSGDDEDYRLVFEHSGGVTIHYDSSKDRLDLSTNDLKNLFASFEVYQLESALLEQGIVVDVIAQEDITLSDLASETMQMGKLIGEILPLLLMVGVSVGVVYPAIDIVTGEKERHTLETLRSLPITSLEIVTSKFTTIALCGIVSTVLNLLSMLLSFAYFITSMTMESEVSIFEGVELSQMVVPIIITSICLVLFTFFVSAASMIMSSFASTFKEAQNYSSPLMIAIMMPAYITMAPTVSLNAVTSLIPIVNISLLIKSAFTFKLDLAFVLMVIVSNLGYSLLTIILLGKVFNREEILFGSQKGFRLLESRSNIKKGTMPGVSDGVTVFAIGIVVLLYMSTVIANVFESTAVQIAGTQAIILIVPFIYALYIKSDLKELYKLRRFSVKYLLIGIPLMAAGLFLTSTLQNLLLQAIPGLEVLLEALEDALLLDNMFIYVIVVAVLPAICEELLFRGFLLTAFRVEQYPVAAILVTSLMFGVFHMNVFQLITGMVLGSVLGFVTYKTKSIYPAMILHFMNNGIAVLLG